MNAKQLRTKSDTSTLQVGRLPVAPEFTDTLISAVFSTLESALKALHVPEEVVRLARSASELSYYQTEIYRSPAQFIEKKQDDRFAIEEVVIEAANAIAACGGTFSDDMGATTPREGTILAGRVGL